MLTDYHTHTFRCGHAVGALEDYVESAIAKGIGEIGLTDHLWLYFEKPAKRDLRWAMPEEQYAEHYAEMVAVRERYRGRINVRISVEADYIEGEEEQLTRILHGFEYDYILGSVHFMDGWLIDDPEQAHRYREERVAEIYRRYYRRLQKAISLGAFDLLAHFDLPKKFGFLPEEDLSNIVGETLEMARRADLAIEVSTAGLRKPAGELYPSPWILREMRRREIPISLSSDAHDPADVALDYDRAIAAVREAGYSELAVFEGRRRRLLPLG
jgi:histidinol-phosphatase (PHP family)